ncbi:FxLD family lanthipeptide [Streptomyces nigra]|uniref:FxLD family lanthipeptide n=1 Tax=Streptomyces nigra TaxID=1827580 RepID=UPI0036C2DD35
MSTQTIEPTAGTPEHAAADAETDDPFQLDITLIENTPDTETVLMCSTGDTCGSSCPSACSGSAV